MTPVRALAGVGLLALGLTACSGASTPVAASVPVAIAGGHDTDPRDDGRPVVLIAAALGVPTEVFRTAFSGVTPAAAGSAPEAAQVGLNKAALLRVLRPYGITNERLDEVSNHYRYLQSAGQSWPFVEATAVASVVDGKVTSIRVTRAGSGYSSVPTVTVKGATAVATLAYGKAFATNGSVTAISLA